MPEPLPESIDAEIRALIAAGKHHRATELLAETYLEPTYRYCFHMLNGDAGRANDVTQQVFEEACKAISSYRGAASTKTWLMAIARNRCLKEMDTQQRRKALLQENVEHVASRMHTDPPPASEAVLLSREWLSRLQSALEQLEPEARSILVMRFGVGLPHEFSVNEIVQVLGISRAAVYRKLQDALESLRRVIHDDAS